jgi:hypothetical protein
MMLLQPADWDSSALGVSPGWSAALSLVAAQAATRHSVADIIAMFLRKVIDTVLYFEIMPRSVNHSSWQCKGRRKNQDVTGQENSCMTNAPPSPWHPLHQNNTGDSS